MWLRRNSRKRWEITIFSILLGVWGGPLGPDWGRVEWSALKSNHSSSKDVLTWGRTPSLTEKAGEEEKQLKMIDWVKSTLYLCKVYNLNWEHVDLPSVSCRVINFERGQSLREASEHTVNTHKPIKGIMTDQKNIWQKHANWFQGITISYVMFFHEWYETTEDPRLGTRGYQRGETDRSRNLQVF